MDWVDRPKNCKGLYGILQLLQGSHLDKFPLKTFKLDWVAFHSVTFQLRCLDFQSNQYKKLVPFLSRFCNGLLGLIWFGRRGGLANANAGARELPSRSNGPVWDHYFLSAARCSTHNSSLRPMQVNN